MTVSPLVEAEHLVRRDPASGRMLLHPASFALQPGDRVAITGASGSGKSVLLRAIAKEMKRTEGSLRQKAMALGIRLGHRR